MIILSVHLQMCPSIWPIPDLRSDKQKFFYEKGSSRVCVDSFNLFNVEKWIDFRYRLSSQVSLDFSATFVSEFLQLLHFHTGEPFLITPEGQLWEKGILTTPEKNETVGFQCLEHSNCTICTPLGPFCWNKFSTFSLSYPPLQHCSLSEGVELFVPFGGDIWQMRLCEHNGVPEFPRGRSASGRPMVERVGRPNYSLVAVH